MNIIEDLHAAAAEVRRYSSVIIAAAEAGRHGSAIIATAESLGVDPNGETYGEDLCNVLEAIAERIEAECCMRPLDRDGDPIERGGEYYGADGRKWRVVSFKPGAPYDVVGVCKGKANSHLKGVWLSKTPTDTQERIDADKRKSFRRYWGCIDADCSRCPAQVDGKNPAERYGIGGLACYECAVAQGMDIGLRQAALDARSAR